MRVLLWLYRHADGCVLTLYALLSVVLTFPLVLNFFHAVPGHGADDPYLAWNIWWVKWSLLDLGSNPLFSNYIFYPIGVNLGTYTLTLLNGLLAIPVQLVWDVIPANNVMVLFSITIAAFGAYLLAKDLVGQKSLGATTGAVAAGLVYGFGSYRFNYLYLGHFNFNSNEWLPFFTLFLLRIFRGGSHSVWKGVMAGIFFVFTGWTESTFAAFLAVFTACYLLFRLLVERAHFFRRQVLLSLIALGLICLAGLSPLILAVAGDLSRYGNFLLSGPNRAEFLSADLLSFFIPSHFNPWLGFLSRDLPYHNMDYAFVGYATLLLAVIGIRSRRPRADFSFLGIASLLFAAVMLGPVLHIANQPLNSVPLPFALVQSIPLLGANRLPVRYDHLVMLAVAVLAGTGVYSVLARFKKYRVLFVLLPVLILVEHLGVPLSMSDLTAPVVYRKIGAVPGDFAILDLPLSWSSSTAIQGTLYTQSQFYQTVHHKRLLGGNTSRPPPFELQYFNELPVIHSLILLENGGTVDASTLAQDVQAAPELARFFGLKYVVAKKDMLAAGVLDYLAQVSSLKPISNDDGVLAYSLEPVASPRLTIDQSQSLSRIYFGDDWGRVQSDASGKAFRWSTESHALMYAPLTPVDYQMCGFYAGAREGQSLRLSVNNVKAGEVSLSTAWTQHCFALPARALHTGINSVVFETDLVSLESATYPQDRAVGQTGVFAPKDIAVTSAGFPGGKFASLTFDGRETYATKRGFYLMAIDPRGFGSPSLQMFDTFRDVSESTRLADFIRRLPPGTIVAGAVCDDASVHLNQEGVDALKTLGVSFDLRGHFRWSFAFIGVKGASASAAIEASDASFPANVSTGKDVTMPNIGFALGNVEFTPTAK